MKKFSSEKKITGIKDSINYISANELKEYLSVADVFLSDDSKEIIKWLIANNKTYIQDLSKDDDENAIVGFYNAGKPKDEKLGILWDHIRMVLKSDRILEIPTLQTPEEFKSIISKTVPADYVILQLGTKEGREAIPKRYSRLIEKLISQWNGKSNFTYDDLKSLAYEGITWAMNSYGKRGKRGKAEDDSYINKTFGQYAAYQIRIAILENIKNLSHIVRIPISQQKKEKESKGTNTKSYTVSGDRIITKGKDGDGNKSIFDFIGMTDNTESNLDNEDMDKLWHDVLAELDKEFNDDTMDIFYSFFGINGYKKMKNKDIAAKYNCSPSKINYYVYRVVNFIKTNKKINKMFSEINELMHECMHDRDLENHDEEPYYINIKENSQDQEE